MGIYISGVKGLPEQVQENKENIKDIQEEIEGIDWDAIHNLENQVAENTQDINNMEGTIGTQNIAITNLGGRVDTLEGKTQHIGADATKTVITGNVDISGEVNLSDDLVLNTDQANNIVLGYTNKILDINSDATYIQIDNNDYVNIVVENGVYEFDGQGNISFNGTPIGGSTLYEHNLTIGSTASRCSLTFLSASATPIASYNDLLNYLNTNGFTSISASKPAYGFVSNNTIVGIYAGDGGLTIYIRRYNNLYEAYTGLNTFEDVVVAL